jgi:acyl carrier protein phosphodiesterase
MNHLAHLLVARRTGTSPSGALLADALRHIEGDDYPADFVTGVKLHHAVDDFTDAHPAVARSRARLDASARHYRGVLVDVYYDHCLAARWARFSEEPLRLFADATYATLSSELARPAWPEAPWVRRMIAADWLTRFGRPEGAFEALRRMTHRARRPRLLDDAARLLGAAHDGLQADFDLFFPELLAHVEAGS